MANRAYLYATDDPSDVAAWVGVACWSIEVPFVGELLMSGDPKPCMSAIYDESEPTAVIADYELGLQRMLTFIERIRYPVAASLMAETRAFLSAPETRRRYLILEAAELFWMDDRPPAQLLEDLLWCFGKSQWNANIELARLELEPKFKPTFADRLAALLGRAKEYPERLEPYRQLGFGAWSTALPVDFA